MHKTADKKGGKRTVRQTSFAKRIVSAFLGCNDLTPAQRAKLTEMDKDYEELMRRRRGDKDEETLEQN